MGDNFFLDNDYTKKQMSAINKIKDKKGTQKDSMVGDLDALISDINKYNKNKKISDVSDKNLKLFKYIDNVAGLDSFIRMVDANGDNKISKEEAQKLAQYDGDKALTSKDVNKLIDDIKSMKSATVTNDKTGEKTVYKYGTDGKTLKSLVKTDKDGNILKKKTYNDDGTINTAVNNVRHTITEYHYDAKGNKTSDVYVSDGTKKITLKSKYTYDKNGRPATKIEYISDSTGVRAKHYVEYQYDDKDGKLISAQKYKSESAKGKKIGDYTYTYDKETGRLESRYNSVNKVTKKYSYDDAGKLKEVFFYDENQKLLRNNEVNEDGTYKNSIVFVDGKEKYFYVYSYKNGVRTKAEKYDYDAYQKSSENSRPEPISVAKYEDGLKVSETSGGKTKTFKYDENYNLTARITDKFVYRYTYDKYCNRTKMEKYNASDCDKNGEPKQGAKPVETKDYTK